MISNPWGPEPRPQCRCTLPDFRPVDGPIVLRALTVRPCWAYAICWLGKRIENRSRPIPRAMIGKRIAIHAGRPSTRAEAHAEAERWQRWTDDRYPSSLAVRAVVATAVLVETLPGHAGDVDPLPPWADPAAACWWRLDDVRTLDWPVPVPRGQLGVWPLADKAAALVTAAGSKVQP